MKTENPPPWKSNDNFFFNRIPDSNDYCILKNSLESVWTQLTDIDFVFNNEQADNGFVLLLYLHFVSEQSQMKVLIVLQILSIVFICFLLSSFILQNSVKKSSATCILHICICFDKLYELLQRAISDKLKEDYAKQNQKKTATVCLCIGSRQLFGVFSLPFLSFFGRMS